MAIYLRLDLNLSLIPIEGLRAFVGSCIHSRCLDANVQGSDEAHKVYSDLHWIGVKESTSVDKFDFLFHLDREVVFAELSKIHAFGNCNVDEISNLQYDLEHTVACFCDVSNYSIDVVNKEFDSLKIKLRHLVKWNSRINWFRSGVGLDQGRLDAANNFFSKSGSIYIPFFNLADIRRFFHLHGSEAERELIFRKIRSNYNNKNTRDNGKKKPCSFSIERKTELVIEQLAAKVGVTRANLLDLIFNSVNKNDLKILCERGRVAYQSQVNATMYKSLLNLPNQFWGGSPAMEYRLSMSENSKKNVVRPKTSSSDEGGEI